MKQLSMSAKRAILIEDPDKDKIVVKSAGRVLEILEYFDDVQREANVADISSALGYPQSSTSALLRSLVKLGYVHHDPHKRTYISSSRVALLGHWINPAMCREGPLIELMKDITAATGDATILATRRGLYSQYVHVVQATSPARLHLNVGALRPLAASGTGLTLMSTLDDRDIGRLVNRINAESTDDSAKVIPRDVMETIQLTRRQGYSLCLNMVSPGGGVLSTVLPQEEGEPTMVIAIGGIGEVISQREEKLAALLLRRVERFRAERMEARLSPGVQMIGTASTTIM